MVKESSAVRKARKKLERIAAHREAGDHRGVTRMADVWTKRRNHKPGFGYNRRNAKPGAVTITKGA